MAQARGACADACLLKQVSLACRVRGESAANGCNSHREWIMQGNGAIKGSRHPRFFHGFWAIAASLGSASIQSTPSGSFSGFGPRHNTQPECANPCSWVRQAPCRYIPRAAFRRHEPHQADAELGPLPSRFPRSRAGALATIERLSSFIPPITHLRPLSRGWRPDPATPRIQGAKPPRTSSPLTPASRRQARRSLNQGKEAPSARLVRRAQKEPPLPIIMALFILPAFISSPGMAERYVAHRGYGPGMHKTGRFIALLHKLRNIPHA